MKALKTQFSLFVLVSMAACANLCVADVFKVRVFYQESAGIESMLQSTVSSVSSPDFQVVYTGVEDNDWASAAALSALLVSTQQSDPADGFFLACRNSDLDEISIDFRAKFPKVPFVDTFSPALMAANIVSYRYAAITGSKDNMDLTESLVERLGITSHLRSGAGPAPYDDSLLIAYQDFALGADKDTVIPFVVALGESLTGSDHLYDLVINVEAIALVGCEGFLDLGVASEAQSQLATAKIPLQVINPIKASMGLLYSLVRNKVWISSEVE